MTALIPIGLLVASVAGLVLLWLARRADQTAHRAPWPRGAIVRDTLVYVLGANLAFIGQEVALVGAKALLPGVEATLFHNSHDWVGDHPDLALAQGAGIVGLLVVAGFGWLLATRAVPGSFAAATGWWTMFHGAVAALIGVASGVASPEVETGQSLMALGLSGSAALVVGVVAVICVPLLALNLGPSLAPVHSGDGATSFQVAQRRVLLPAALAVPLLVVFRLPSVEQAAAGLLLLVVAAPWAALGAAGAPLPGVPGADHEQASQPWPAAIWATVASLVVAVALAPGLTVG